MLFFSVITQVRKSLIAKKMFGFSPSLKKKMQVKSQFLENGKKSNYGLR